MRPKVFEYFETALEMGASDLILKPGSPPTYRTNKHLVITEDESLAPQEMYDLFLPLINANQQTKLREDFCSCTVFNYKNGKSRIRYYIFHQREGLAGSFRFVPPKTPSIEELKLPSVLHNIAAQPRGIFLVTGAACSGKTATIAAMVESINKRFTRHIITMEEQIEIVYTPKKSVFTQVEIGKVINSYFDAVINSLREDPDVMVVGDLRNKDVMQQTLMAAETGHLVLSSLPTMGAVSTIEHIVSMFPTSKQDETRNQLSQSLIGIFSQKLIPGIDSYQSPKLAYELMIVNSAMKNLIREKKYSQINTVMSMAKRDGCVTMQDSLMRLLRDDSVDQDIIKRQLQEIEE